MEALIYIYRGHTVRCAKSWLFSITGSHGSQGPEFCTLQPLLVHQGSPQSRPTKLAPKISKKQLYLNTYA